MEELALELLEELALALIEELDEAAEEAALEAAVDAEELEFVDAVEDELESPPPPPPQAANKPRLSSIRAGLSIRVRIGILIALIEVDQHRRQTAPEKARRQRH